LFGARVRFVFLQSRYNDYHNKASRVLPREKQQLGYLQINFLDYNLAETELSYPPPPPAPNQFFFL
jgi:hypothetical protein